MKWLVQFPAHSFGLIARAEIDLIYMHDNVWSIKSNSCRAGRNQASFLTKVLVLTRRSFVNMYRDVGYYWLRLGIYIAISICLGTIFFNFGYEYEDIRVSLLLTYILCPCDTYELYDVICKSNYHHNILAPSFCFRLDHQCLCSLVAF